MPTETMTAAEYLRAIGSRGGKARLKALTPKERSESARKAITARWQKATPAERREAARKAARARWAKRKPRERS